MKITLLLISLFLSGISSADTRIETIQLNHRLATELLPEVNAFLPESATAHAFNNFIILNASDTVIKDIKQLINKLDTPLQRLRISVLKTVNELKNTDDEHETIDKVKVQRWSTADAKSNEQYFQIQGIADQPLLIESKQAIPQQEQRLVFHASGQVTAESNTTYLNINSGFKASARILPNHQVVIDIHPNFGQYSAQTGIINRSQIISSLSGPVDEWIELGRIDNERNTEKHGSTRYHSHRKLQKIIYIKVSPLH